MLDPQEWPSLKFLKIDEFFVSKCIGPWEIWMKFLYVIFKQISVIDGWGISCEIALIWMPLDFTDD